MSKFTLKLEQLVQTDKFGDMLLTVQYDGKGPKFVSILSESLSLDVKNGLDTVLSLVNFMLAKGITPVEISGQFEIEPKDGVYLPLNELLVEFADTLKALPATVKDITPESLMTVSPEMVKELTQNSVSI
jgi:hypothetical protein